MTFDQGNQPPSPILIVDDEIDALQSFMFTLGSNGLNNVISCSESRQVNGILEKNEVEVVILDLIMPGLSGEVVLSGIIERFPQVPVIIVTGINDVETAVECMQKGAFDYVLKPVKSERLIPSVQRAIEMRELRRENAKLTQCIFSDSLEQPEQFAHIITQSPKMQSIFKYCEAIAKGSHPILITGETGVGKELVAEALHKISMRQGDFVALNVAGLEDTVFSDTLFGHLKGAFTNAASTRKGLIEKAEGGTLFLDEIGDLSLTSQIKFLRLLDKREYFPLGSDVPKPINVRFLFATHRDLGSLVQKDAFREDLFYRLRTHCVHVPALRERLDDIPLLLSHFVDRAAVEFGKNPPTYHRELLSLLQSYPFPGNIRELKSMVFDAVGGHNANFISTEFFREKIQGNRDETCLLPPFSPSMKPWIDQLRHFPTIKETTAALIDEALSRAKNNQRVAALMLGITPQALNQRLKKRS